MPPKGLLELGLFIFYYHQLDCEDHNEFCEEMARDYDYCVSKDPGINSWMSGSCSKSCGYCFDPETFETSLEKYVT